MADAFPAYHLPALPAPRTESRESVRGPHRTLLAHPVLDPEEISAQAAALVAAGEELRATRSTGEMVALIDGVARRFLDPRDPLRHEAAKHLPALTGYSPEMVAAVLEGMAREWTSGALERLLAAELPDRDVLYDFSPRAGVPGLTRAFPPRLVTHVFSGNVPGVAVTSLVRALLLRAPSLGKTAATEPVVPVLFARAVAEADPLAGRALAVAWWPGADRERTEASLREAEAVVAYGSSETVERVREASSPHARFLGYGHRVSFGIVTREVTDGEAPGLAREAARDVALFDQQGCVSPHLYYVEEGGDVDAAAWSRLLADALARVEERLPRGALDPGESAMIRELRTEAEFGDLADRGGAVHASAEGTAWTVLHDPDPGFAASCLNRVVRVKPIASMKALRERTAPLRHLLQTVGVAGSPERRRAIAGWLGEMGASRIVPFGKMAWPPSTWHHDGRPPLTELLRWCDLEG